MITQDKIFVGNEWVNSCGNETLEVISPFTEQVVGHTPAAVVGDVDAALAAARAAFETGPWPRMSMEDRISYLRAVVDAFELHAEEAIEIQIEEMGGTRTFVEGITHPIRSALDRLISDVDLVTFSEVRRGTIGDVIVTREPIGVTAGITPWNGPLFSAFYKIAPSLLMGCPVVVKLAPQAPLSARVLAEAFRQAALPAGTVSILAGGAEAGAHLVGHPQVDLVSFTGSDTVGATIGAICGRDIRSCVLELGGKSAAIVLDGDISEYAPMIIGNAFRNAGQVCVSPNRVLVPRHRADEMTQAIAEAVLALRVGDPHERSTDMGPVVSAAQRDRVERYIRYGIEDGARLVVGGRRPDGVERGYFVEPTVFADVLPSMRIAREEIFGPVLSILAYDGIEEAIEIANDSDYGLGGTVYSADVERAVQVAMRVRTGTCSINGGPPAGGGGPFGGVKRSGVGRERSREGLESYLEVKSITLPAGVPAPTTVGTSRR